MRTEQHRVNWIVVKYVDLPAYTHAHAHARVIIGWCVVKRCRIVACYSALRAGPLTSGDYPPYPPFMPGGLA